VSTAEFGLLDTSTLILLSRIADPTLLPEHPRISTITLAELSVGPLVARDDAERAARLAHLQQAEADFDPLPFDGRRGPGLWFGCGRTPARRSEAGGTGIRRHDRRHRDRERSCCLYVQPTGLRGD